MYMKKKLLAALLASALAAGMLPTSACAASDYTTANATLVTLTDSSATAKGKYTGYEIDGTDVSITAAGTYVFSGDCDNGSITVKKGVTGVTIVLNGLTLTNDDSAADHPEQDRRGVPDCGGGHDQHGCRHRRLQRRERGGQGQERRERSSISGTGTLTVDGNAKNGIKGAVYGSQETRFNLSNT